VAPVRAGLLGQPADLANVHDGGLDATLDFRRIYANVLEKWLAVPAASILGDGLEPFAIT
jgi:hypothetical protein